MYTECPLFPTLNSQLFWGEWQKLSDIQNALYCHSICFFAKTNSFEEANKLARLPWKIDFALSKVSAITFLILFRG